MARTTIDRLIINSPYEKPQQLLCYDLEPRIFELVESRYRNTFMSFSSFNMVNVWNFQM